ncbi:hypothetical protein GCM10007377_05090 [Galliscardovia ingluviei]|uniref:SPOR domain-containing protein n=2 Tax=Galliscardovia ingluviei TaxID=1769422 RepID=A0A8J3EXW0_9BIFI|nr:hypothetical protein GCM10007377_05090 [Galliscardovia ingluviei]
MVNVALLFVKGFGMKQQWYFNMRTGKVELGKLSPVTERMGPYASKEDAEHAWQIVQTRNKRWEDDDRKWNSR